MVFVVNINGGIFWLQIKGVAERAVGRSVGRRFLAPMSGLLLLLVMMVMMMVMVMSLEESFPPMCTVGELLE